MQWWAVAICVALYTLAMALAFPPAGVWPLVFVAPIPLILAAVHARRSSVLLTWVFIFQFAGWLAIQSWIRDVSVAGWPAFAVYLAIWAVLLAGCLRILGRSSRFQRMPLAVVAPIVWLGIEYLRGSLILGGYPWYLLGQPVIGWVPLAQVADLGGQELAGVLPAAVAGAVCDVMLKGRLDRNRRIASVLGTLVLACVVVGYGFLRVRPIDAGEPGPRILLIQTNITTSNKMAWTPQQKIVDVNDFAQLTLDAIGQLQERNLKPDLVVWPETMLPGPGLESASVEAYEIGGWFPGTYFRDLALGLQGRIGVPLLLGSSSYEGLLAPESGQFTWDGHYNSAYLIQDPDNVQRYDKVNLTPFGERMPVISNFPWLEERLLALGATGMTFDLDAAEDFSRFEVPIAANSSASVTIATPICFEDTVPWVCREMVWGSGGPGKRALLLVNLSNDGWFGSSISGRRAHLLAARFRAIENRVPLVRSVNTGITAWVDSSGRIRAELPAEETASLLAAPRLDRGWTVFGAIGQLIPAIMSMVLLLGIVLAGYRNRVATHVEGSS